VNVKTKNKTATARYTIQWTKLIAKVWTPTLQTTFSSEDPKNNGTKQFNPTLTSGDNTEGKKKSLLLPYNIPK